MDEIKEAFLRVRKDIDFLYSELMELKEDIKQIQELVLEFGNIIKNQNNLSTNASTNQHLNSTIPTYISTHSTHIKPLKPENLGISTGNKGVPTDRQTDRQTDKQTDKSSYNQENKKENSIEDAMEFLDSLDNLKKEIRIKFKRLTDQEMRVFSLLYQLSEEEGYSDYKTLSSKLGLTESSARDYVGRLIKKGIPVEKKRINNKTIHLSVSENLKKIATLPTIIQLRDV